MRVGTWIKVTWITALALLSVSTARAERFMTCGAQPTRLEIESQAVGGFRILSADGRPPRSVDISTKTANETCYLTFTDRGVSHGKTVVAFSLASPSGWKKMALEEIQGPPGRPIPLPKGTRCEPQSGFGSAWRKCKNPNDSSLEAMTCKFASTADGSYTVATFKYNRSSDEFTRHITRYRPDGVGRPDGFSVLSATSEKMSGKNSCVLSFFEAASGDGPAVASATFPVGRLNTRQQFILIPPAARTGSLPSIPSSPRLPPEKVACDVRPEFAGMVENCEWQLKSPRSRRGQPFGTRPGHPSRGTDR